MNIETGRVVPAEEGKRLREMFDEPYVQVPKRLERHAAKASLSRVRIHGRGALARWARKERAKRKRRRRAEAQSRKRNRR